MLQRNHLSGDKLMGTEENEIQAAQAAATDRYYNSRAWAGRQRDRAGRLSHGCIAWMLGLPLPIIILAFLWRGCD